MTEHKKRPRDAFWLLAGFYRGVHAAMSGKHGPAVAMLSWVGLTLVILACGGRILWEALLTMPPGLAVFIGSVVAIRLVRWYLRR
jgi:hypothetical protein